MTAAAVEGVDRELGPLTTLGFGGSARVLSIDSAEAFLAAADDLRRNGVRPVVLGHGSNVVIADGRIDAPVLRMETAGVSVYPEHDQVEVTLDAGVPLGDFVAASLAEGWSGVESLAGVPGTVGAMPVQNVSAYGCDTASIVKRLTVWDWRTHRRRTLSAVDCRFGYRSSIFKRSGRWTILDVTFGLRRSTMSAPVHYPEVADELGVTPGIAVSCADVATAVVNVRRRKGMVVEPSNRDARSVGSIFKRARVSASIAVRLASKGAPAYVHADGSTVIPSSWLIGAAGFRRGESLTPGVRVSTQYFTLVATAGVTCRSFLDAMVMVHQRVLARFDVAVEPEPHYIGSRAASPQLTVMTW